MSECSILEEREHAVIQKQCVPSSERDKQVGLRLAEKEAAERKLCGSSLRVGILSDQSFSSLEGSVSDLTLKAIDEMGFKKMTEIQTKAIPHLLEGKDLLGQAKTGSGKTLAFLVPAIELIYKSKSMLTKDTGVIILSPTRELSLQTYGILQKLLRYHSHTHGLVMGGASFNVEAAKLVKGVNILVATPGRLLEHLNNTKDFLFENLQCLIFDEADRLLDIGFKKQLRKIVDILPRTRQTMLFSATSTQKVEDLARLALKECAIVVGVDDVVEKATVEGLEQSYVVCPSENRLLMLLSFLEQNCKKKVMVFFSSCFSVEFHHQLLNHIDLQVMCIHGKQKQNKRTTTFLQFCKAETGILLCTDVAARGLDIPAVDWIVQYDPPHEPKEYIHRVGRTARGQGGEGHALIFLKPEELGFLPYLKQAKVPLNEYQFSWSSDIQPQLEKLISEKSTLRKSAKKAYKSYIGAYRAHLLKGIFDVRTLDLAQVAQSFCYKIPQICEAPIAGTKKPKKKSFKEENVV